MYIADLHIHSRYSRATSRDCTPEILELWARKKGIRLLGTGDFTHPAWREELKEKLVPAEEGLYTLKEEYRVRDPLTDDSGTPRFVVTGEISSIYKQGERVRKVHSLLLLPGLEDAERLSLRLEQIGNIHSLTVGPYWDCPAMISLRLCWSFVRKPSIFLRISGRLIFHYSERSPALIQSRNALGI